MATSHWSDHTSSAIPKLDWPSRIMLVSAAAWALGLGVAALTVPFYSESGSPFLTTSNATLVQVNGPKSLIPIAVPLLAVVVVATALSHRRKNQKTGPGAVAIIVVALLCVGTFLAMLSIGVFFVPVDVLVLIACVRAFNPSGDGPTSWPPDAKQPQRAE